MIELLKQEYILTPEDDHTHLEIPFELKKDYEKLHFKFLYSPKWVEEERAIMLINEHLNEVIPKEQFSEWGDANRYLPLENLITLSLDYNNQYIGAHHCKDATQNILISNEKSTKGFLKQSVSQGNWSIKMNMHCVQSEKVTLKLQISVE